MIDARQHICSLRQQENRAPILRWTTTSSRAGCRIHCGARRS